MRKETSWVVIARGESEPWHGRLVSQPSSFGILIHEEVENHEHIEPTQRRVGRGLRGSQLKKNQCKAMEDNYASFLEEKSIVQYTIKPLSRSVKQIALVVSQSEWYLTG